MDRKLPSSLRFYPHLARRVILRHLSSSNCLYFNNLEVHPYGRRLAHSRPCPSAQSGGRRERLYLSEPGPADFRQRSPLTAFSQGIDFPMKVLDNSKPRPDYEDVPVVNATPISPRKPEAVLAEVVPVRPAFSNAETAIIFFLRQFRVLLGAARLYQRNHPRLMEILASTEQQLRIALAARTPLVIAIEPNGMLLPGQEGSGSELLHDPRGELRGLAEELLRGGICSFLFTQPINVGELDLLVHEISLVPRSASPGDTASRKLWDNWIKLRGVVGIRINIPTERRDSLLLASLMSAVLAYENTAQHSSHTRAMRAMPEAGFEQIAVTLRVLAKLAPPHDPEMKPSAEDIARRFHSVVSGSDATSISLIVHGVSNVRPREGESLAPYL